MRPYAVTIASMVALTDAGSDTSQVNPPLPPPILVAVSSAA